MQLATLFESSDTQSVATVAAFRGEGDDAEILIVKREAEPEAGKWCLPGGHGKPKETPHETALREFNEETGLEARRSVHVLDARLPGERGKSEALYAVKFTAGDDVEAKAASDAGEAKWVPMKDLLEHDLAFGHFGYAVAAYETMYPKKAESLLNPRGVILEKKEKEVRTGLLIVFEGCDGMGKSTQVEKLVGWLQERGYRVEQTKWNSAKPLRKAIKQLKADRELTPSLYSLMHAADMIYRYEHDVLPALAKDKVVVCDRYGPYTSKVRDEVRGVDTSYLDKVYGHFRKPDIMFYCDAPVEVAFSRLLKDKGLSYYGAGLDLKLSGNDEENCLEYQRRMKKGYDKCAKGEPFAHRLNMNRKVRDIFQEVTDVLYKKYGIGKFTFK